MAAQSLERTGSLSAKAACTASDSDGIAGDSAGDSIEYTIDLENTGTTTLTAVDVSSAALRHQLDRYLHRVGWRYDAKLELYESFL